MYQLEHWHTNALLSSAHAWCAQLLQEPTPLQDTFFRITKFTALANRFDIVFNIFKMLFRTNAAYIFLFIHKSISVLPFNTRGGVEDTRLEAKDSKKKNTRPSPKTVLPRTDLSRPRTEMFEAKDQGHDAEVNSKKKGLRSKIS